jgi:hypothetical protein
VLNKRFTLIIHCISLEVPSYETVLLQRSVLKTKTSAQRVTSMGVKAHMDPRFTLISGCLILTVSPVTYSVSLPSVVLLLRVWGLSCKLDSQPAFDFS